MKALKICKFEEFTPKSKAEIGEALEREFFDLCLKDNESDSLEDFIENPKNKQALEDFFFFSSPEGKVGGLRKMLNRLFPDEKNVCLVDAEDAIGWYELKLHIDAQLNSFWESEKGKKRDMEGYGSFFKFIALYRAKYEVKCSITPTVSMLQFVADKKMIG